MTTNGGSASKRIRFGSALGIATAVLSMGTAFTMLAVKPARAGGGCCGGGDGAKAGDGESAGGKAAAAESKSSGLLVDLGNAKCPIMGGKPNGTTWSEWNGLRIGHCCGMCTSKFAADPEKAMKQAGIEWKGAAAAVKKVNEAKGADRDKAIAELKKQWTVLREPAMPVAPAGTLVDLGNAKCPVMGGDVDGKTYTEWNGLRVGHCCPGCSEKLLADPAKVLDRAKIEWKTAADSVKAVDAAKGVERTKALAELKKKWTVVREPVPQEANE